MLSNVDVGQTLFDNDSEDDAKYCEDDTNYDCDGGDEDLQEGVPPVPSIGVIK